MQQSASLLPDLFPRNRLYLGGLDFVQTVNDFLLPRGVVPTLGELLPARRAPLPPSHRKEPADEPGRAPNPA